MELELIKNSWKKQDFKTNMIVEKPMKDIEKVISKKASGTTSKLLKSIRNGLFFQIFLFCANVIILYLFDYSSGIFVFTTVQQLLLIFFIWFCWKAYQRLKNTSNLSENIRDVLYSKIKFYKKHYQYWLHIIAITASFLFFSVSVLRDYYNPTLIYERLNQTIIISGLLYFVIYFLIRFLHFQYLSQYEIFLGELQDEEIEQFVIKAKRIKIIQYIILVLIAIIFLIFVLQKLII